MKLFWKQVAEAVRPVGRWRRARPTDSGVQIRGRDAAQDREDLLRHGKTGSEQLKMSAVEENLLLWCHYGAWSCCPQCGLKTRQSLTQRSLNPGSGEALAALCWRPKKFQHSLPKSLLYCII